MNDFKEFESYKIPKDVENKLAQDVQKDEYGHQYNHESLLKSIIHTSIFGNNMETNPGSGEGNSGVGDNITLDSSLFKRNPLGWNIKKACEWLQSNAGSGAKHVCAKYVRMAIEAGGISTEGRPTWAWKYINYLPTIGFKFMFKVKQNGYTPEPGDIAVYLKGNNKDVPGHICMWTGVQWCSDFKQNNLIVYKATQEAYIFRFAG